jgi:cytochrome P450
MLAAWDDDEHINVHDELMRLTLAIVAKALFGADVEDEAPTVKHVMAVIQDGFTARMDSGLPLPDSVPLPANLRMRRALRQLDQVIYRVIADARASTDEQAHLVSLLLEATDEHGDRLSDREIRDESVTFFLAGHETTALALTWAFCLLAEHPDSEARLHRELATLAGRPPGLKDVADLPFTAAVVNEAMRLYPPVYVMGRDAIAPCRIGGVDLPAGSTAIWSQWVLHRDPRYWDSPEAFDPDRWTDERVKSLPRFVYFPFGGGPQQCIGASFAALEATLILAAVAQRFRLRLQPGHEVLPHAQITLRPRGGMPMILHARTPAPAAEGVSLG